MNENDTMLTVIDIQEKLTPLMVEREEFLKNTVKLVRGFRALALPVLVTEQTPDKLGPTVAQVADEVHGYPLITKASFGCLGEPAFRRALEESGRRQVVLCGIETHICVFQTARQLLEAGWQVYIAADAVSSRAALNRQVGLDAAARAGATISCVEMILFELLRSAHHPRAREIFRIVK